MPTERDPQTLRRLERRLTHEDPGVRLDAVLLLTWVDCTRRREWLEMRINDADSVVRRAARKIIDTCPHPDDIAAELLESDFASQERSPGWSWEYTVRVYHGPRRATDLRVWLADEDDHTARQLASVKAGVESGSKLDLADSYVLSRCFVNEHTRSARSKREADLWLLHGRPLPPIVDED